MRSLSRLALDFSAAARCDALSSRAAAACVHMCRMACFEPTNRSMCVPSHGTTHTGRGQSLVNLCAPCTTSELFGNGRQRLCRTLRAVLDASEGEQKKMTETLRHPDPPLPAQATSVCKPLEATYHTAAPPLHEPKQPQHPAALPAKTGGMQGWGGARGGRRGQEEAGGGRRGGWVGGWG